MRTMKSAFITVVVGLWFLIMPLAAQALPTVTMELADPIITLGETFIIDVIAGGVTAVDAFWGFDELLAFGFDVEYNGAAFAYNGAAVDFAFFDDSGLFPDTDVAGSAFPGISGNNILLASLSFTSLMTGNYSLGISSSLSDLNEGLITWCYPQMDLSTNIDLCVTAEPVPEPATLLLFGAGLAGLVGMRRKKF